MSTTEAKRIQAFQRELVSIIPRFPNDRASQGSLEAKHLTDLLITYIGWRVRFVGVRSRTVRNEAVLAGDPLATGMTENLQAFFSAVRAGEDLTPYLSLQPRTRGYSPAAEGAVPSGESWADKDFLLNVMGLHHFHLGLNKEAPGHMERTDEVLFASVTRDEFEILGLFDHAAFDHEEDGQMTDERKRLWSAYEVRESRALLPGQLAIGGLGGLGLTLSSHPTAVVMTAQRHARIIREVDRKLDEPGFAASLYPGGQAPAKPKLRWHYNHLDLGLFDTRAGHFLRFEAGPN